MKKIIVLVIITIVTFSCKKNATNDAKKVSIEKDSITKKYPEALTAIFDKHGGINNWKKMKTLSYGLNKEEHTTDLHSRKTVINAAEYSLGFDGENVWVSDTTIYKKNPKFYYNLYFYFYAMPYVLADDGIIYSETTPLEFEGKKYPGIKISYKSNVGLSPNDNYYVYYDAVTKKMSWLAYTVTYFSKKPSDNFSIIRYTDWQNINGLLLPKYLTWYEKDETGNPTKPTGEPVEFSLPLLSETSLDASFYKNKKTLTK